MSIQFGSTLHTFVKQDDLNLVKANTFGISRASPNRANETSVGCKNSPVPLRDDHIVLLAVEALLALRASFKKWRNHRRTLKVLADLDEHQLRDIGLKRVDAVLGHHNSYRTLVELD